LEFAPLATALPICKIGFARVWLVKPGDDDYVSVKVACAIRNDTARDWQFVSVRMQVLDAGGCPIKELHDLVERPVKAGSDAVLNLECDGVTARQIGSDAPRVQVVIHAIAGVIEERELGEASIPSAPHQSVQLQPRAQWAAVRTHGLSLWRTPPDSDGDARVVLQSLMQNVLPMTMPKVELRVTIEDAAGRELITDEAGAALRAGSTDLFAASGYTKAAVLSGATAKMRARVYTPVAMAFAYNGAGQRHSDSARQSAKLRDPSPPPSVPPPTPVASGPAALAHGSAGPSQTPPSPEKVQAATEKFLAAVKDKVRSRSVFARPEIVKYKLENALASFAPGVEARDALVLIDSTVFGSAKDGLLVTASALYAKDLGAEPRSIPIRDVKDVKLASGMLVDMLRINGLDFFNSSGVDKVMPDFVEALATFCRDINS
jgi:hypothetical protein